MWLHDSLWLLLIVSLGSMVAALVVHAARASILRVYLDHICGCLWSYRWTVALVRLSTHGLLSLRGLSWEGAETCRAWHQSVLHSILPKIHLLASIDRGSTGSVVG